jgi:Ca2+-binding RTX toxin-like protein
MSRPIPGPILPVVATLLVFGWTAAPAQAAPRCFGKPATIVGTSGRDEIEGTGKADVIVGLQGNDTIIGFGGSDRICGGAGADWMNGKGGPDRISGGQRYDVLHGRAGNDVLDGGPGGDGLYADSGNDVLLGGPGEDDLSPASGTDTTRGDDGDDTVAGGLGNDSIDGGSGVDSYDSAYSPGPLNVNLPAGRITSPDWTHTVIGIEQVRGSSRDDVFLGDGADNLFLPLGGNDSVDGGGGRDVVSFAWAADLHSGDTTGVTVDLAAETAAGEGSDSLMGIEDVIGSEATDFLRGDDGPNLLFGYGSEDTFEGRGGDDVLDGGYTDPQNDLDVGDGGPHVSGDTCIGIEQATNCESSIPGPARFPSGTA